MVRIEYFFMVPHEEAYPQGIGGKLIDARGDAVLSDDMVFRQGFAPTAFLPINREVERGVVHDDVDIVAIGPSNPMP